MRWGRGQIQQRCNFRDWTFLQQPILNGWLPHNVERSQTTVLAFQKDKWPRKKWVSYGLCFFFYFLCKPHRMNLHKMKTSHWDNSSNQITCILLMLVLYKLSFKTNLTLTVISGHIICVDLSSDQKGSHAVGISLVIHKDQVWLKQWLHRSFD